MKAEEILRKVRYDFPQTGAIVVGLSGGADSTLLTHLLLEKYGAARLHAVHVNHGIRGAEAGRDERFVRDFCAVRGLRLTVFQRDVPRLAAERREGLEECARRVRYACFAETAAGESDTIATAHNADDNAETLLLNLARGMGPRGAGGIPRRRDKLRRPLLGVSRAEVEFLCEVFHLDWVEDSTNAEETYTRNRLRRRVLPELREINPRLSDAVSRFTASMALENDFMQAQAEALLRAARTAGGLSLPVLRAAHPALLHRALEIYLQPLGRMSYEHLLRAADCVLCGGGLTLPGGAVLSVKQDTLTVMDVKPTSFTLPVTQAEALLPNGKKLIVSRKFIKNGKNSPNVHNLLFKNRLDCDRITGVPVIRTRRAGDRFAPYGRGVTKPVKKLFNELRIPAAARGAVLLLELDGTIVWIEGVGPAEGFAACFEEGWALEIQVCGET